MSISAEKSVCISMRQRASRLQLYSLLALALATCLLVIPTPGQAQVNPEIANCSELKDEGTAFQADICSAHIGCRFVMNIQKTCAKAKGYLDRLRTAINDGARTLLNTRKEVTPDAVFVAALGADDMQKQRQLAGNASFQQRAKEIGDRVREVGSGKEYTGNFTDGSSYIYYGQLADGVPDGFGTKIASSGEIQRGQFDRRNLAGEADVLYSSGSRFVGAFRPGGVRDGLEVTSTGRVDNGTYNQITQTFIGNRTYPDGTRFQGRVDRAALTEGKLYRADGTLAEEGKYEGGKLSVGTRYDVGGRAVAVGRQMAGEGGNAAAKANPMPSNTSVAAPPQPASRTDTAAARPGSTASRGKLTVETLMSRCEQELVGYIDSLYQLSIGGGQTQSRAYYSEYARQTRAPIDAKTALELSPERVVSTYKEEVEAMKRRTGQQGNAPLWICFLKQRIDER